MDVGEQPEQARSEPAEVLAREVRLWRIDRVLAALALGTTGAVTVLALQVPFDDRPTVWSWLAFAPVVLALGAASTGAARQWRRRAWRDEGLDTVGASRIDRVRADLARGTVSTGQRALAIQLVLNSGVQARNLGWATLGMGAAQAVALDATSRVFGLRVGLGATMLVLAVASLVSAHRNFGRAAPLLEPAGSTQAPEAARGFQGLSQHA